MSDFSKPLVLVTGATGFIGSQLAARLLADGWRLRLLVRERQRLAPALAAGAEVIVGDLGDPAALAQAVSQVALVFHCAANVNTWDTKENYLSVNVIGVGNLMAALARERSTLTRLVHLSTVDVYGFPATACTEEGPSGGDAFGYGASKLQGEAVVRQLGAAHGIPFTILRPTNVIGPGSPFIVRIGEALNSGLMLTVDGGQANAGLLMVDHLIDCMLWAATATGAAGQTYNVRDCEDMTWATFLRRFRTAIGGRGLIIDLPFWLADTLAAGLEFVHRVILPTREPLLHRLLVRIFGRTCGHDATRIHAASGLVDHRDTEQALDRSFRWFRERPPTA
ncbi:NAD(P)-dependent oxidoreductase [uncultured Thiodictyon sp.]|uniref:NAD-dependent epimerase/dehydratase family protein n=1 Tax=uncultured Thiodictyon sp. TaxID=1846217 RepID=UPI0025FC77E5|nr:NAD-dependent epimerase/dehydratase family protein [uncultured Thiodictyon sp.]